MSLTEGEIFVAYWPGWLSAIGCLSIALGIVVTPDINQPEGSSISNLTCTKCGHGRNIRDLSKWNGGPL